MIQITKEQARSFLVRYHHLTEDTGLHSSNDILTYINKVGCIQYDPINILSYNSHLVMQSRFNNYKAAILDELLYKRMLLIDGWDKNLSIYNVEDHRYLYRHVDDFRSSFDRLHEEVKRTIPSLMEALTETGPISSADIKDSPQIDWWWAPTKAVRAALDYLFASGQVYIHHKVNTRKYYDLMYNHPNYMNDGFRFDDHNAYLCWHLKRRIGGVGMLPAGRNTYAFIAVKGLKAADRRTCIEQLVDSGEIVPVVIESVEEIYYVRLEDLPLLEQVTDEKNDITIPKSSIIAPLDNLIWDRNMISEIFDFDYIWEVYKPKAQREYGYYVLPVLYGNMFAARIEAKYNRQVNQLEVNNWFIEPGVEVTDEMTLSMGSMLGEFRDFLGADRIKIMPTCKNKKVIGTIKRYASVTVRNSVL